MFGRWESGLKYNFHLSLKQSQRGKLVLVSLIIFKCVMLEFCDIINYFWSRHLLVQQWQYQNIELILFRVNNRETSERRHRRRFGVFIVNLEQALYIISIFNSEEVNADWVYGMYFYLFKVNNKTSRLFCCVRSKWIFKARVGAGMFK